MSGQQANHDEHGRDATGTYREVCFWADCNADRHAAYCEHPDGNQSWPYKSPRGGKCYPWKTDDDEMRKCRGFRANPEWAGNQ